MKTDIHWLKKKVEAGAEYVVTQMFFDNSKYFDFVDRCRKEGIDIPIIPGFKPLTSMKQLSGIRISFTLIFQRSSLIWPVSANRMTK